MNKHELANHIDTKGRNEAGYAIAYALLKLANATESLSIWVKYLGNGDAATPMGAIEAFGKHIGEKLDELGDKLS